VTPSGGSFAYSAIQYGSLLDPYVVQCGLYKSKGLGVNIAAVKQIC